MEKENRAICVSYNVVIPVFNLIVDTGMEKILQFNYKPARTTPQEIILDSFTIALFRWDVNDKSVSNILEQYCPPKSLPDKFDFFDAFPPQYASAMLIVQVRELYPPGPGQDILVKLSNSVYAEQIIPCLEYSLKLHHDAEPHFYKGYCFKNRVNTGTIMHWPIKEMQGPPMRIDRDAFDHISRLLFTLLGISESHRDSVGYRVLQIAMRYYVLSSRQTDYDIIFLMLMIAFEAICKKSDEESVSRARACFGRLLAESKKEYSQISRFMSEDPNEKGCCFLRNAIVHGDVNTGSVRSQTFWDLKRYLRRAIVRLIDALDKSNIDPSNYYDSLDRYVNSRFSELPTK